MTDPVRTQPPAAVVAAIERASRATGADFSMLVETARRESSFNPNARASTSSATGLFQFIDSTWLATLRRHGAEHGLGAYAAQISPAGVVADPARRAEILALRNNPEIAARMAAELTLDNARTLEARLGRQPGAGELYAAHVLGPAGALRLIEAAGAGAQSAAALFPREAAANRGLFFRDGAPLTAAGLLDRFGAASGGGGAAVTGRGDAIPAADEALSPMSSVYADFLAALLPLLRIERRNDDTARAEALAAYARAAPAAINASTSSSE